MKGKLSVAKTNNFIELNGKRYDAVTGAFLGVGLQPTSDAKPLASYMKASPNHGKVMDGIMPSKAAHAAVAHALKPAVPKPVVTHLVKPIAHHKPQSAKTLRRDIVKLPIIKPQKPLKLQQPTDIMQHKPGVLTVVPKLSSDVVDPARATRAQHVPQSPQIERFRKQQTPRPTHHAALAPSRPINRSMEPVSHVRTPMRVEGRQVLPANKPAETDIFEQAIAYAKSHEQPSPKAIGHQKAKRSHRRQKKIAGVFASVAMLAALSGFIFWQNRADIELQLASARSGVPASMPAYRPSGYAIKGMTYSPGTVTIGFLGNSGSFSVVQKSSNWDSETLLQNYVATSGQAYNAYSAAGRTVYVYGNDNATWVNGGIWYQINDQGQLSKDQLINLATSM